MKYDQENDRIIADDGVLKIYPTGLTFPKSKSLSVELGITDHNMVLPANKVRELIDGLTQAATRLGV